MRIITLITENYIPGLRALDNSLRANSGIDYALTVLKIGEFPDPEVGAEYFSFPPVEFDRRLQRLNRLVPSLEKLSVFRLPYRETCLYIDADVICLNPLHRVHEYEPLTAVINQSQIGRPLGYERNYRSKSTIWNAGVFWFRPDPLLFLKLQEYALGYDRQIKFGDQNILNDYFDGQMNFADLSWNNTPYISYKHPELFDLRQVKLLHSAWSEKPWLHRPVQPFDQKFFPVWYEYCDNADRELLARLQGPAEQPPGE